ncbi:tetratricopeptide repeat protein [Algiphilus sp.]|uniref:tetratricopeptide repeat protein n=1 Tax=Algiphilus sp. TaxID=1872431 RepID=UPI0025BC3A74|nr:tetratricopeptide repeat protein [Algiphilus sp.]MCK5770281.1 tetratricopeptide repeat protein [Algiphilus sp.]
MFGSLGMAVLLLPLGLALGWQLHRLSRETPEESSGTPVSPDYLEGLQLLASGDPDRAIAALTRAVAVDQDTIELHLTLGRLFRKRGEVDRAMRIHQHLLAREGIPAAQVNQVRLELARDYHEAGLLDRAEGLYRELIDDGMFLEDALRALLAILEQTRDWAAAESVAQRLQSVLGQSHALQIAHYCCEQADAALAAGDRDRALALAERALDVDGGCVRASLLLGELQEKAGQYRAALRAYERVPEQDLDFFAMVLPRLRRVHAELGRDGGYRRYLVAAEKHYDSVQPVLARLRLDAEGGGDVVEELVALCRRQPTWTGLRMLAEMRAGHDDLAQVLHEGMETALQSAPQNRCENCGLTPRMLFWQCPSCKQWATIRPRSDRLQNN